MKCNIYLTLQEDGAILVTPSERRQGSWPKAARAEKDMTQGTLAEAVGVSRQTVNAIEKGEYNPTINLCRSICKVLGKTLDDLFWEE